MTDASREIKKRDSVFILAIERGVFNSGGVKISDFPCSSSVYENTSQTLLHVLSMLPEKHDVLLSMLNDPEWFSPQDIDVMDIQKRTPLMRALSKRNFAGARVLLERGADVSCIDEKGMDALMFLCENESDETSEMVDVLLGKGADVSLVSKDGMTAAKLACLSGQWGVAERLIERGCPIVPFELQKSGRVSGGDDRDLNADNLIASLASKGATASEDFLSLLSMLSKRYEPSQHSLKNALIFNFSSLQEKTFSFLTGLLTDEDIAEEVLSELSSCSSGREEPSFDMMLSLMVDKLPESSLAKWVDDKRLSDMDKSKANVQKRYFMVKTKPQKSKRGSAAP